MPAPAGGAAPGGPRGHRRALAVLALLVVVAAVVAAVVLVLPGDGPATTGPATTAPPTAATTTTTGPVTTAERAAVRAAVDAFNAGAGGPPQAQRSLLRTLVDPAVVADLDACAPPTTTVRLEPAWQDVRRAPAGGTLLVPALVRIYSGTRITGTDVALVDVTVVAGQARLPALCVS